MEITKMNIATIFDADVTVSDEIESTQQQQGHSNIRSRN